MPSERKAERLFHLDAARAIMLLLGIPFHVCEVYRVSGGFGIDSPDNSVVASLVSGLIHCFRMPAFFLLSGYFAAMMMRRRGAGPWLRGRLVRLGVPLVSTTLTLGLIEQAATLWFNERIIFSAALGQALDDPLATWINHRWFLIVLMLYCASVAGASSVTKMAERLDHWLDAGRSRRGWMRVAIFCALLATPFAAIVSGKVLGEWFVPSPAGKQYANFYVKYGIFFTSGVVIFAVRDGLRRFPTLSPAAISLAALFIGLYLMTYFAFYPEGAATGRALSLIRIGVEGIAGYYGAKLFFALMQRLFTRQNGLVAYFVDASLCIYLVHEIFIIATAGYFLSVSWPPIVEIVLTCSAVLACSVLVYELARRTPILSLPLNGGPFGLQTSWGRRSAKASARAGL